MKKKSVVFIVLLMLTLIIGSFVGCQNKESVPLEHRHSFVGEWLSDEIGHWKKCECGETTAKAAHNFVGDACSECGYKKEEEQPDHIHSFAGEWLSDEIGHWKKCECGETSARTAHSYGDYIVDGNKHYKMCDCGYETERVDHVYGDYIIEGDKHYQKCECGFMTTKTAHSYSKYVAEEEQHYQQCVCGHETERVNHVYGDYIIEGDKHYQQCVCGHETEKINHSYGNYIIEGDKHYKRCICGYETEKITHTYMEKYVQTEVEHSNVCVCGDEISADHTFSNGVCTVCDYSSDLIKNLTFADTVEGECSVTGIVDKTVTKVIIPDKYQGKKVTGISDFAFRGCASLTSFTFGENVAYVGYSAFGGCGNLVDVNYTGDLTAWCGIEFKDNESNPLNRGAKLYIQGDLVVDLAISSGMNIGAYAFRGCSSIVNVHITGNLSTIGTSAFRSCSNLTKVIIVAQVSGIGSYAFYDCKSLAYVDLPNDLETIGNNAFYSCTSLAKIKFPGSLRTVGSSAFYNCEQIKELEFNDNLCVIGDNAFYGCIGLTSVNIPSNVESVGDRAFANCTSLKNVTVAENINELGDEIFINCSPEEAAVPVCIAEDLIKSELINLTITGGAIVDNLFTDGEKLKQVTIKDNVTAIGNYAFLGCPNLTTVTIGNGVESIGDSAFYACTSLTTITFGNEIKRVGAGAFSYCSELKEVYIDDIASWCQIEFLEIEWDTNVKNHAANPLYLGATLYIHGEPLQEDLIVPKEVTEISSYAFYGCKILKNVTLENGVKIIGSRAFEKCSNLTNIAIADSVIKIGTEAFYGCNKLQFTEEADAYYLGNSENQYIALMDVNTGVTEFTIKDQTRVIAALAFSNCSKLKDINIPDNIHGIGDDAFRSCSSLTNVTIGNGIEDIGNNVFYDCKNLKYTLEAGVNYLGNSDNQHLLLVGVASNDILQCTVNENTKIILGYAFYDCGNLASITISENVTSIGRDAFLNCYKLIEICNKSNLDIQAGKETYGNIGLYAKNVYKPGEGESKLQNHEGFTFYVDEVKKEYYLLGFDGDDENIVLPDSCDGKKYEIYKYAFYKNKKIRNVVIGSGVTRMGESAFGDCEKLWRVTIKEGLTTIENFVFSGRTYIGTIDIPKSVTKICAGTFIRRDLAHVFYSGSDEDWANIDIGDENYGLIKAIRYYYSVNNPYQDGTASPLYKYWHYKEDGTIEVWAQ